MAFVAAATSVGAAVLGTGAAAGIGSTLVGGALIGAGVGGAYSALTGDGNVLNSMLTGGLIGAGGAGLGSAMGLGSAAGGAGGAGGLTPAAAASAPSTAAVPTANVATVTPAMQAAALDAAAVAEGATTAGMVPAANTGLPAGTAIPPVTTDVAAKTAGLTNKQMLGYGLAGSAALSLLGARNQPSLSNVSTDAGQIRPYTYSQTINPNYGMPGEPYYIQSYTAQEPYAAKAGGLMKLAYGGPVESMSSMDQQQGMYPQGMMDKTYYATPSQRPASMEVIKSDYDTPVNPMTGLGRQFARGGSIRYADGGQAQIPQGLAAIQNMPIPQVNQLTMAPPVTTYTQPAPAQNPSVAAYNQILADRAANEYVAQAPLLSMLPGGGERASAADTSKLINEMYLKNLGRQGEQAGLDYWTGRKMSGDMSLADIGKAIGQSQEAVARREAMAPPKPIYFDPEFYLAQNPDITRVSEYKTDPFLHYQRHGFKEGRAGAKGYTGTEMLGLAPKPTTGKKRFGYDPVTQTYSGGLPQPETQADDGGFLSTISNDPNFLGFLQNQYTQYQQSMQGGGGKAGGLMPAALKGGGLPEYNLGSYSDGGRLLKGPGDGVSDDIPAVIGKNQPARLADGEFVIPARIVSEIGNGSTDAGAKRLYAMMDKIQAGRKKTIGKNNVAKDTNAKKHLLA